MLSAQQSRAPPPGRVLTSCWPPRGRNPRRRAARCDLLVMLKNARMLSCPGQYVIIMFSGQGQSVSGPGQHVIMLSGQGQYVIMLSAQVQYFIVISGCNVQRSICDGQCEDRAKASLMINTNLWKHFLRFRQEFY